MRTYGRTTCPCCGKDISTNGLAYTNHMRMHVRRGQATEHWDEGLQWRRFEVVRKPKGAKP